MYNWKTILRSVPKRQFSARDILKIMALINNYYMLLFLSEWLKKIYNGIILSLFKKNMI